MVEKYGDNNFGRGCLMARRLVEVGVPFVEVNSGGWDLHQNCFTSLETKLPELDKAFAALMEDLKQRGLLESTVVLCMGEFGRTPRINGDGGPRSLCPGVERGAGRRGDQGRPGDREDERRRHERRERVAFVGRPDGDGLPGARHLAARRRTRRRTAGR